jgi:hypothetical protein
MERSLAVSAKRSLLSHFVVRTVYFSFPIPDPIFAERRVIA